VSSIQNCKGKLQRKIADDLESLGGYEQRRCCVCLIKEPSFRAPDVFKFCHNVTMY
jgi:hypothetical protein